MKKLLVLALAFMMLLSVIACSNPTTSDPTPDPRPNEYRGDSRSHGCSGRRGDPGCSVRCS